MKKTLAGTTLLMVCGLTGLFAGDYSARQLKLSHPDGFYKSGEEVVVTGQLFKGKAPAAEEKLRVVTKWEGKLVDSKDIPRSGSLTRTTSLGGSISASW